VNELELISPVTEQVIARVSNGSAQDVAAAVACARDALPDWSRTAPQQRAARLHSLADAYETRRGEIAELVASENGSPRWWTVRENEQHAPRVYRHFAGIAAAMAQESVVRENGNGSLLVREPVGVVGAIVPWNSPQVILAGKLGAALASGCTTVVKPAPETSRSTLLLKSLAEESGLPPGVLNVVTGDRDTGRALVAHDDVDKIAFTGSTAAGRDIAARCGAALKPVTAELGGKSALIMLDDADAGLLHDSLLQVCVPFSGQVCFACTRILVPESRRVEMLESIVTGLRKLRVGDPRDPDVELGPLVNAPQRDRVERYIDAGRRAGARCVLGGSRPSDLAPGYYASPTVFTDVAPEMSIFREEIFGPVLCVSTYRSEDEAVALHNATNYGLHGAIYTADPPRARRLARRLLTGGVQINNARGAASVARAAYKGSGLGMGGAPVIDEYLLSKQVAMPGEAL
jgi:acyl-CoA reductase-like NAD-dependent aldehyde dehydrogenase